MKDLPAFQSKHLHQYQLHTNNGKLVQLNNVLQLKICMKVSTDNTKLVKMSNNE